MNICMHFNPQLFKVSIIQTKLFGPLDFELSRFHCTCYELDLLLDAMEGSLILRICRSVNF